MQQLVLFNLEEMMTYEEIIEAIREEREKRTAFFNPIKSEMEV